MTIFDIRNTMRVQQKNNFEHKLFQEPYSDHDDEREVRAISDTGNNMRIYNLKSSNDCKVPKDEQTNSNKKLKQIVLLEGLKCLK